METPVLPKRAPRFTLAHISLALGLLGALLIVLGTLYLVFQPATPEYVDTSLAKADQTRQRDLHEIRDALKNYYQNNSQQYPVLTVTIDGANDPLSLELVPLYLKKMPVDADPSSPYYYASLTGKSFLLRARLSSGTLYEVTDETP